MKKMFSTFVLVVMCVCASAQINQLFWFNGRLMFGAAIAQTDSLVFSDDASALDTLHLLLPRTVTIVRHDTIYVHDTAYVQNTVYVHDTVYVNNCDNTEAEDEGALSGAFSVGVNTQVHFSQGNLQYQASTQTWRFADNQYDMAGNDNANISASYSGWIDLFGWGTGNNPTNTSQNNNDYSTFVDWGVNAISNGGNEANRWRTLTKDEWAYLFCSRPNAASLFGLGSVNGINGTIILPDNWSTPQDALFTPSTTQGIEDQIWYYENPNGNNFSHNTYTAEQWLEMEENGAVFLPASGGRWRTGVYGINGGGNYWSSSPYDSGLACYLFFGTSSFHPQETCDYAFGRSVRLVR